ncbi:PTS lactose/cellobiose transporter subunit IIA [Garciella nitratireducens]|uniref:PTS system, cellobiose-specific IIA component n=1 Tax=Garciella nitratireducens DSM 15102 TaxID=1121911 RepID=A0A1T4M0V5_9FIRM|nr:PTS lactose/cellobiose transporter subunit IIA [Garciella nitratireducens]SJZ60526.1 PTS system, cellobiose-specific IIA component [Garciella nitratireducens DSM 15102]
MNEQLIESISFQLISNIGTAKSFIMEALYSAKAGNFELADKKLKEADQYFTEGHKIHASLIQKEASGEKLNFSLLIMHAEDQLMSTETIRELVKEMIDIYRKIQK